MLDIHGTQWSRTCEGFGRRDFLKVGTLALTGLTLADWFQLKAYGQTTTAPAKSATARSVIMLWMGGGPPHTDTFDPKPQAGEDYTGPLRRPIATNVSGIQIGEMMPLMAKQADKYALLRGMTHPSNGHETATYIMQTGSLPSGELVYPALGSVVAYKREEAGYKNVLPPFVSIPSTLGRFSECGFLGTGYAPFATGGDPNNKDFRVGGLVPPSGVKIERLEERRSLLEAVDTLARKMEKEGQFQTLDAYQEKAYGLILGEAKKAFDISQEKDPLRERYGRTTFGQSCLLARRLVENGVPFVSINFGGWDTHKQHFEAMKKLLPILDQGFSALLEDLAARGLLDSTIVYWGGEFGRTPKVAVDPPFSGGRHHYCTAFSCVVAGGGFKGGKVVGSTDQKGERVVNRPIYPWDVSASMYQLLGIDPAGRLPHPRGCVAYVTPPANGQNPGGGMLREIM